MEIFYFKLIEKSSFIFYISPFLTTNHHKISVIRIKDETPRSFTMLRAVKRR